MSTWDPIFNQAETLYGLPPGLLSAIAKQEGVNPKYNNPLGLSTDKGPMKFSEEEAPTHIFNQAKLMTSPTGPYKKFVQTGNLDDLAAVYSPVGAKNDIYGTNTGEASGIRAFMAKAGQSSPNIWQGSAVTSAPTSPVPAPVSGGAYAFGTGSNPAGMSTGADYASALQSGGAFSGIGSALSRMGQSQIAQGAGSAAQGSNQALAMLMQQRPSALAAYLPPISSYITGGY